MRHAANSLTTAIMAAVVFLMAEIIGVPYLTICAAAALPALFYYASLFATVYAEAVRQGIKTADESTSLRDVVRATLRSALPDGTSPFSRAEGVPHVIFVVGVNGGGKTTTVGKLAALEVLKSS